MTGFIEKEMAKTFAAELTKKAPKIFRELKEEAKYFLKTGLVEYLDYQINKYSKIKTLLHGVEQVELYDVYYPLKLVHNDKIYLTESANVLLKANRCITISGDAGSGKSTLIKHLFLNSIYEYFSIPILLELRYLEESNGDIYEYIHQNIFNNRITESDRIYERLLHEGKFVFFLDGFDEIPSQIRKKSIKSLNMFIERYHYNSFIITTRPYTNIEMLPNFLSLEICPLSETDGDIEGFIDKQLSGNEELASKIKESITNNQNEYIQSFLSNPLLLSLYILTYQSNADIPNKKYIFYRRVINALFSEHDSKTKLGFVREKTSGLSAENFHRILKLYSFLSFFEAKYSFDIDYVNNLFNIIKQKYEDVEFDNELLSNDLKIAVALWLEDNGILSFAHRSLQEYYAANFIYNLDVKNKEKLYNKIIDKFAKKKSLLETEHFLSLCEEMDKLYFYKYYYLPLLHEIKNKLKIKDENMLIKTYLSFLIKTIRIRKKFYRRFLHNDIIINNEVYKSIYIHIEHTKKLYDIMLRVIAIQINKKKYKGNEPYLKKTRKRIYLEISKINASSFPEIFKNKEILQLSRDFLNFIDSKITEIDTFIKKTTHIDEEIVDLI